MLHSVVIICPHIWATISIITTITHPFSFFFLLCSFSSSYLAQFPASYSILGTRCIYIGTAGLSYTLTVLILFLLIIIIIIILLLLLPSLLVSQFILTWCNEPHGYSCINHVSIIDKTIDWLIYEHQI